MNFARSLLLISILAACGGSGSTDGRRGVNSSFPTTPTQGAGGSSAAPSTQAGGAGSDSVAPSNQGGSAAMDYASSAAAPSTQGGRGSSDAEPTSQQAVSGSSAPTTTQSGGSGGNVSEPSSADDCETAGVDNITPFSDTYRVLPIGTTTFQGITYAIVTSMPWTYVLSRVQCRKSFPMTETDTHYIVDSHFELPYIQGVMDDVAWTPGLKNKGWAIGSNDDPAEFIAKNGAMRPFVYHVNAGYEYGYFTYTDDPLPGDGIRYTAYRPTWVVHTDGASAAMFFIDPADPDKYGFAWPRHGDHWELNFGLYVDLDGKVYVPKAEKAPLGLKLGWDDYQGCVVINKGGAPIPTTRTQFPGNESYYASETFLPGYAAPGAIGHRYWGQKGRAMEEVAIWEDDGAEGLNSPGNFHKPYSGGCDTAGYNFSHAEGFTWPALRAAHAKLGDVPTREQLYKITLYKYEGKTQQTSLLGTLSYEQQADGQWIPTGSGPEAHSLNDANGRWIINGPVFQDRGDHVYAVVEDL